MYKVIVRGDASTQYPWPEEIDGVDCQDEFSDYFSDEEQSLKEKGVKNGYLEFKFEGDVLYAVTTYDSPVELTDEELEILKDYTQGQWSDGIGEGFEQEPCREGDEYEYYGDMTRDIFVSPWHRSQAITITQQKI